MSTSFITFGCWNNGLCNIKNRTQGVSHVIGNLIDKKSKLEPYPDFFVITGDNYYPIKNKENNKKYFNETNFISGMDCIKALKQTYKKPVYMLMGNH